MVCHAERRAVTILLPQTRKDPATGWKNILAADQIPGGTTTRSANTIALAAPLSAPRAHAGSRCACLIVPRRGTMFAPARKFAMPLADGSEGRIFAGMNQIICNCGAIYESVNPKDRTRDLNL